MLHLVAGNKVTSTVFGLSDDQLLEQTGRLARLDHRVHVFVIDHLIEIESRRVYLRRGFSSLFDYVKRGLGYSDAATWRRINAMKLCARIEGVRDRLWDGSLTLDAAAQLQAAFERRNRFQRCDRERARGAATGTGSAPRPSGSARPCRHGRPVRSRRRNRGRFRSWTYRRRKRWWSKRRQEHAGGDEDAGRAGSRAGGAGRSGAAALGAQGGDRRGLPARVLKGFLSHVDRMTQLVGRLVSEGLTATTLVAVDAGAAQTGLWRVTAPTGVLRGRRNGLPRTRTP